MTTGALFSLLYEMKQVDSRYGQTETSPQKAVVAKVKEGIEHIKRQQLNDDLCQPGVLSEHGDYIIAKSAALSMARQTPEDRNVMMRQKISDYG